MNADSRIADSRIVVVALGDSTTAGTPLFQSPIEAPPNGAGDERSQFAYWLMQQHPDWDVRNCGVNGERSDQIAARFDRDVLGNHARVVVIIAGVNDVYQGRSAESVREQLRQMYAQAAQAGIPVIAGSIVPYNTATSAQNHAMHAINDWIRNETTRHGNLTFVDTRAATAASDNRDRLASSPDELHPDIAGYRRMAEALAPAIERALGSTLPHPSAPLRTPAHPVLIAFDLDGTLIDSRQDLAESTNEMLESYGAPPLPIDEVASLVGEGARVLVQRALAAAGLNPDEPDALARFLSIYNRRLLIHTQLYDGIREVVEAAASRAALAVLTNKPEAPSRQLLDAFGLSSYFRWVIGGDSGFPRKPDPAGLLHLISASGASPTTTLFVGDSMIDVYTARAAGARACVAHFGFGHLRVSLSLTDGELSAHTPTDIGRAIETFMGLLRPSA